MDLVLKEVTAGLQSLHEVLSVSLRLLFAALVGGVIGFERERAGKPAGLRTHMLVSVGAAIFVIAPMALGFKEDALSRIIQGLVTGIGFLGAGAILKSRNKEDVEGLTTAAGIWLTAGLGVAVGLGGLGIAIICVVLAWIILTVLFKLEERIKKSVPEKPGK
jgi:putative Mg2+ transporter-C (MgtC) family protein